MSKVVRPGDTLVLRLPPSASAEEALRVQERAMRLMPVGARVMVITGADIAVVRGEVSE